MFPAITCFFRRSVQENVPDSSKKRQYVHEIDFLRLVTSLIVVAVHVLGLLSYIPKSETGFYLQKVLETSGHFSRTLFMTVTAFIFIFLSYRQKTFSSWQFWKKRSIGILLPYIFWSVLYLFYYTPDIWQHSVWELVSQALLTGSASNQLYFIVVLLQFYLLFPLFLRLIWALRNYPWQVLSVSFLFQLLIYGVSYRYIQTGRLADWPLVSLLQHYEDRLLFSYQFYFFLGAYAAIYFQQVKAWIVQQGKLILGSMLVGALLLWAHFFWVVDISSPESLDYASSPLQPVMLIYSVVMILALFWLSIQWSKWREGRQNLYVQKGIQKLANATFGVYLIHPLILVNVNMDVVPFFAEHFATTITLLCTWLLTAGIAMGVSVLSAYVPLINLLFGQVRKKQPAQQIAQKRIHQEEKEYTREAIEAKAS